MERRACRVYGLFRTLRICLSSHKTRSPSVAGERDLGPVSPVRSSVCLAVRWHPRLQRELAPLPHPNHCAAGQCSSAWVGRFGPATRCARSIFHRDMPLDFCLAFGISSAGAVRREGHRKSCCASSAFFHHLNVTVLLIIPWSQVRVLAGPPSIMQIIGLWHRDQGIRVPWSKP